jgi:hypothetical protein
MWKILYGRTGNIIRRMRFACWIAKAKNTHSEFAILMAFARQQWLHESSLMLPYTYITCSVCQKDESYTKCSRHMTNKNSNGRLLLFTNFVRNTFQCTDSKIHSRILIIKANEMHYFSNLFHKVLYIFRTSQLSIIRSISTLYTRNGYLSC